MKIVQYYWGSEYDEDRNMGNRNRISMDLLDNEMLFDSGSTKIQENYASTS